MKLSIVLCATAPYLYTWKTTLRRIVANASHREDVHVVYVSDDSQECKKAFSLLQSEVPSFWVKEHRPLKLNNTGKPYGVEQQILIAQLYGEGFAAARLAKADQCWTLENDVLSPPDALRTLEWALQMPQEDGSPYYDVAFCTYPNGQFIGGRGDLAHPIAEDATPEERELTEEVKARYEEHQKEEKEWVASKKIPDEAWQKKAKELADDIKKCPPKGNCFALNAIRWRPRGWMDSAYPGIGRGALVPVDWCGQGCNLLSKRALAVSTFEGYDGRGTQDLFLCWKRYFPNNIRIACSTHTACDHVKQTIVKEIIEGPVTEGEKFPMEREVKKLIHHQVQHEQLGECRGHLRIVAKEWVDL